MLDEDEDEDDLILFIHFIQWVFIINLVVADVDHFIFANNINKFRRNKKIGFVCIDGWAIVLF